MEDRNAGVRRSNPKPFYKFDKVFPPKVHNSDIFKEVIENEVQKSLQGFNTTIMVYGVTGSGKTHTIFGNLGFKDLTETSPSTENGLVYYVFKQLADVPNCQISLTYVEIYNEQVKDLLGPDSNMNIAETPTGEVVIQGVTTRPVRQYSDIVSVINEGNQRRKTAKTCANAFSSRSHAILQVGIRKQDGDIVYNSKISFIDLAGSERVMMTQNKGKRLTEAANINKSLLALGKVINSLSREDSSAFDPSSSYVPYRDSKLTRLLKDSLGGNTKTLMITCISPYVKQWEETLHSLSYAVRAQGIRGKSLQAQKTKVLPGQNVFGSSLFGENSCATQVNQREKELEGVLTRIVHVLEKHWNLRDSGAATHSQLDSSKKEREQNLQEIVRYIKTKNLLPSSHPPQAMSGMPVFHRGSLPENITSLANSTRINEPKLKGMDIKRDWARDNSPPNQCSNAEEKKSKKDEPDSRSPRDQKPSDVLSSLQRFARRFDIDVSKVRGICGNKLHYKYNAEGCRSVDARESSNRPGSLPKTNYNRKPSPKVQTRPNTKQTERLKTDKSESGYFRELHLKYKGAGIPKGPRNTLNEVGKKDNSLKTVFSAANNPSDALMNTKRSDRLDTAENDPARSPLTLAKALERCSSMIEQDKENMILNTGGQNPVPQSRLPRARERLRELRRRLAEFSGSPEITITREAADEIIEEAFILKHVLTKEEAVVVEKLKNKTQQLTPANPEQKEDFLRQRRHAGFDRCQTSTSAITTDAVAFQEKIRDVRRRQSGQRINTTHDEHNSALRANRGNISDLSQLIGNQTMTTSRIERSERIDSQLARIGRIIN